MPEPAAAGSALRHRGYRGFFLTLATAMMADSVEHVISYWVLFEKFHSPLLGGFAVVSHWLPFLLLSMWAGALADRFDPRRVIQLGMLLFMGVSLAWAVLILTDVLQMWHAMLLLSLHGIAGVLWNPPSQVLIHDIVPAEQIESAVRLNATARYLGLLAGPAVGGLLLMALGPVQGLFFNALLYLPTIWWLWKAPYGPRSRSAPRTRAPALRSLGDIGETCAVVGRDPTLSSMILLAGGASLFVGTAYHAQMPAFAHALDHHHADLSYSALLAADAAGALAAAFALERWRFLRADAGIALRLAVIWCAALAGFALSPTYATALGCLFLAGFTELCFNSTAQALVQVNAPAPVRGRVIGVFVMASLGMRAFSGLSVGVLAGWVGNSAALVFSAAALLTFVLALIAAARTRRARPAVPSLEQIP